MKGEDLMPNTIHSQLGYKSIEELKKKYNGIFELSNKMEIYDVIDIFIRRKIIFSISYNLTNPNIVILKF